MDKKPIQNLPNSRNLLQNKYLTNEDVLSVDETFLGPIGLTFLINVSSRMILGYILCNTTYCNLEPADLIDLIEQLLREKKRAGYPSIHTLHGDKSPLYTDKKFKSLLATNNIGFSWAVGASFQNQISESYNNVLKRNVCKIILEEYTNTELKALNATLPLNLARLSRNRKPSSSEFRKLFFSFDRVKAQMFTAIPKAIEMNNEADHPLFGSSKRKIEKILRNAKRPSELFPELTLVAPGTSEGDKFIKDIMAETKEPSEKLEPTFVLPEIVEETTTENFIEQLKEANRDTNTEVIDSIVAAVQILSDQNQTQTQYLEEQLEYLTEQARITQAEKEAARERKEKRARATQDRKRNAVREDHLEAALVLAKHENPYIEARNKCALVLLYVTGLRSSEILFIKVRTLKDLFQDGLISVDRKKKGAKGKSAILTKSGKNLLAKHRQSFEFLFAFKNDENCYVFTPSNKNKPLSRETLQRDLNKILTGLEIQYPGLHFRTHSMRAGYITNLWRKGFDVNTIRQVIGHKSISITQTYIEDVDSSELQRIISECD